MKKLAEFQEILIDKEFSMSEKEMKKIIPQKFLGFEDRYSKAKKVSTSRKVSSYLEYIDNIIDNKELTMSEFLHEISTNTVIVEELIGDVNLIVEDYRVSNKLVMNFILDRKSKRG